MLIGGSPGRLVRLTPAGRDVLDAALAGVTPTRGEALVRRLVEGGLLHPTGTAPADAVTVVVPVRDGAAWIEPLVAALRAAGEVIVVDDGSRDGTPELAARAGARVVANDRAPGPSGARNAGLALAGTELVAFVDADVVPEEGWLDRLAGLFADARLALAAPRVLSVPGPSRLAAYEVTCSPLDMGPYPAVVGPGRHVGYVPSAALLARREALLDVGGFAEELTVGEDVDLVWRLVERGWRVRYAPDGRVRHHPRPTLRALARQRAHYGASAVELDRRHPGAAAPLRASPSMLAVWAVGLLRGPLAAAAVVAGSAAAAAAAAPAADVRAELAWLTARGHVSTTRYLARVAVREWLPVTALAALGSRRARRLAAVAFAVDALASRGSPALRAVDNTAYAAGLWRAVVRARSAAALLVRGL